MKINYTCPDCHGKGYVFPELKDIKCDECDGTGEIEYMDPIDVAKEVEERSKRRIIRQDRFIAEDGTYFISTVDLCLPAQLLYDGMAFETMIFDPKGSGIYLRRYFGRELAEIGHEVLMSSIRNGLLRLSQLGEREALEDES